MKATILTVMSDPLTRANATFALTHDGFHVIEASDQRGIIEQLRRQFVCLAIVAIHEPNALELCRRIRRETEVPVMVQLQEPNEHSEWLSLQAGAADVISASTSKRVLLARVHSVVQRHPLHAVEEPRTVRVGALLLDLDARTLEVDGTPVVVTRIEFDLLAQLMTQPRRVHIRGELIQAVWGAHYPDHIVETHLSRLRKKIRAAGGPEIGEAVRGIGYRLGVDAREEAMVS